MINSDNFKIAFSSIRANRIRSLFTMFGIIISVATVITAVSLGEGIKSQLSNYISTTGKDTVTIRGGVIDGNTTNSIDTAALLLSPKQLKSSDQSLIEKLPGVKTTASFSLIPGVPDRQENYGSPDNLKVIATTAAAHKILNQPILYGGFFQGNDNNTPTAVIGKHVAEEFFKMNVPIGQKFTFMGKQITVSGVLQEFQSNPLLPSIDYNRGIFLPSSFAQSLVSDPLQPYQIMASPKPDVTPAELATQITAALSSDRLGNVDFSVLKAEDLTSLTGNFLRILNKLVLVFAAIALISGGISIMNIMFVSVSERNQEIGVRKSVGATNNQILSQFLTESIIISFLGAVVGVTCSLVANYVIRLTTNFAPVVSWKIMTLSTLAAIIVGVVFGIIPAIKAARKDPIMALRRL